MITAQGNQNIQAAMELASKLVRGGQKSRNAVRGATAREYNKRVVINGPTLRFDTHGKPLSREQVRSGNLGLSSREALLRHAAGLTGSPIAKPTYSPEARQMGASLLNPGNWSQQKKDNVRSNRRNAIMAALAAAGFNTKSNPGFDDLTLGDTIAPRSGTRAADPLRKQDYQVMADSPLASVLNALIGPSGVRNQTEIDSAMGYRMDDATGELVPSGDPRAVDLPPAAYRLALEQLQEAGYDLGEENLQKTLGADSAYKPGMTPFGLDPQMTAAQSYNEYLSERQDATDEANTRDNSYYDQNVQADTEQAESILFEQLGQVPQVQGLSSLQVYQLLQAPDDFEKFNKARENMLLAKGSGDRWDDLYPVLIQNSEFGFDPMDPVDNGILKILESLY